MFFAAKKAGSRGKSRRKRKTNPNENFNGFMGSFTNKWDKNRQKDGLRAANDKKNNCAPVRTTVLCCKGGFLWV